jgi:hypothetical protein
MTAAPSRPPGPEPDHLLQTPPFPPPRRRADVRTTTSRIWRRTWPWLAAVVVVVLVVVTELALLQGRIRSDVARLRDAAGAPPPPPVSSTRDLPPVPVPAPPAAGDVTGVRLRLLDPPCAAGGPCTVVVAVDRRPGSPATPTTWSVVATDRCHGAQDVLGSGTTPAAAGAFGVATVALPPGRALALVAVTGSPARAASPPVPIGAGPC